MSRRLAVAMRRALRAVAGRPRSVAACAAGLVTAGALVAARPPPYQPPPGDLECLALNIYHEARGEPLEGRLAVAQVVLNRVADDAFPDDVCAVVRQGGERPRNRCQFSWYCDGRSDTPTDRAAWDDSRRLALHTLRGELADPSAGALWYHARSVSPPWGALLHRRTRIGRHVFYTRPARGEAVVRRGPHDGMMPARFP